MSFSIYERISVCAIMLYRGNKDVINDIVLELDRKVGAIGDASSISSQIRKKRFESFNMVWLKETTEQADDQGDHGYMYSDGGPEDQMNGMFDRGQLSHQPNPEVIIPMYLIISLSY